MSPQRTFTTGRLLGLSDGIFAIAMTLLVVTLLDMPDLPSSASQSNLAASLRALGGSVFAVVVSFLLLAIFWRIHHSQYHAIRSSTDVLVWLNFGFLLFVILLPFSTDLMGEYGRFPLATVVFDANMLAIGLFSWAQWWWAARCGLLAPEVSPADVRVGILLNLVVPVLSVVSLALALLLAANASWVYVLAGPASWLVRRWEPSRKAGRSSETDQVSSS